MGKGDRVETVADADAAYDEDEEINLSELQPLITCPSSPDNVVPVREVAGREIYQAYIGPSANPGLRDFAIAALMVEGKQVHDRVSFDVNPTSRQILENLIRMGLLETLIRAGARLHQAGCNGCIGMGQAPATGRISLRTVPRNFPCRSGTQEDQVYLCSPKTAAVSALTGVIWAKVEPGDVLRLPDVRQAIAHGTQLQVINQTKREAYVTEHAMTARQVEMILAGSLINLFRARHATHTQAS
jgi:aconitate hydratase